MSGRIASGPSIRLPSKTKILVAIVGPTATGKSTLGIEIAERFGGEVISCDSTAVYRGFDIGTDKVPLKDRRGIPHHLIDVVDPRENYSAARYATDAAAVIFETSARGRLPILVGGTGLYYRALTRGLFPGPGRDSDLRERLSALSDRYGVERLHRLLHYIDPESADRIHARDVKRLIRALEVYYLTGRPLTRHFEETRSLLAGYSIVGIALRQSSETTAVKVARRVEDQLNEGLVDEVRRLRDAGIPDSAAPFGGMVYRQVLAFLNGVGTEESTQDDIIRANRRYARRQLIWFRKEPNLHWIQVDDGSVYACRVAEQIVREHVVTRSESVVL
ncbi:MAG: tRNA (adenosine(37)-N6)-dimethylallyltransferase MiaA [Acidobacteriota bacterium]|nr:tRNA (adenosine(37)-N6)-dimethylallyltransferase MiaA [Acidobacteriota bacterium]